MRYISSNTGWKIHGSHARLVILTLFALVLLSCGSGDTTESHEENDTTDVMATGNAYDSPPPHGTEREMTGNAENADTSQSMMNSDNMDNRSK